MKKRSIAYIDSAVLWAFLVFTVGIYTSTTLRIAYHLIVGVLVFKPMMIVAFVWGGIATCFAIAVALELGRRPLRPFFYDKADYERIDQERKQHD